MVRIVLYTLGFVVITGLLIALQPGAMPPDRALTAETARPLPAPERDIVRSADPAPVADAVTRTETTFPGLAIAEPQTAPGDGLRDITWAAIARINLATGRSVAPGQPGSLLHAAVQRALQGTEPAAKPSGASAHAGDIYTVVSGDSLVGIAQAIYGDANMTGPLYAANADQLTDPRALKAGQVLRLPAR
ncbi:LysM domain-containing protein [Roseivivax lentus]|uniref:LysM domain-containing protein n=1 Tax=Roseivivax lentus TaxID=633194 RepID=A0A1N7MD17_9RHOB|nr:LysM peptidoglycan-binding domain-containing protein [Roseivivax lentus]SIS83881.1 LysM domain-containing protein [Roseivivax lentus]